MENVWPVTVTGWVTLIASLGTLVIIPVSYGKWLEKMNGLGRRMKRIEDEQERARGTDVARQREIDRVLGQHEDLLRLVGESKRSAEQCLTDAEQHALEIGAQCSEILKAQNKMELGLSQRLTALETEVRLARRRDDE